MQDLFRFVWRGAVGGMIVPLLLNGSGLLYFALISLWTLPIIFFYLAIPGAVVGIALWILCRRAVENIPPIRRAAFGVVTLIGLTGLFAIGSYVTGWGSEYPYQGESGLIEWMRWLLLLSIYFLGAGGLAGIMCPARLLVRPEPRLSYRERVELYETGHLPANNEEEVSSTGDKL